MHLYKKKSFLLISVITFPILISGCNLLEKCENYMDICLISKEKEKDLLDNSNNSNNSQLYKATFNSYKMRLDNIRSQEIFANNEVVTESLTWKKMINDMKTDNCNFFSQSDVNKYNTLGIGPELLYLLKEGKKTFCD